MIVYYSGCEQKTLFPHHIDWENQSRYLYENSVGLCLRVE